MLPELIPIPASAAAEFRVEGTCTGRDISWSLALLLQAVERGEAGEILISDEKTRDALFIKRSDAIERENQRWERLRHLRICGRPAPCVPFETMGGQGEWARRHKTPEGEITVEVDQDLVDLFTDRSGDVVYLPRRLLELGDSRYTVPMMMRVLAWSVGDYPRSWKVVDTARRVKIRVPLQHIVDALDLPVSMKPSQVVGRVLAQVSEEITTFTDYEVTMTPRLAPSTGRIRDIEVSIHVPDVEAAVEAMIQADIVAGQPRTRKPRRYVGGANRPATPVAVSRAALDAAVPLSVVRPKERPKKGAIHQMQSFRQGLRQSLWVMVPERQKSSGEGSTTCSRTAKPS